MKHNLTYRRSIRLKDWEYSNPGLYFITICTKNRQNHFGEIHDGIMGLSIPGCLAYYFWTQIPKHFPNVILDEFIVMPNHVHGIIGITNPDAMNRVPTDPEQPTNSPKSVGSPIHRDRGDSCARAVDHDSEAMNRIPTNPEQPTNSPKSVGSPIHRDRGDSCARVVDHNPDAMNRIPTDPEPPTNSPQMVGSPIHRDRGSSNARGGEHEPEAMNRIPTDASPSTNSPKPVGSPIYRDRGGSDARGGEHEPDAMNRVPTNFGNSTDTGESTDSDSALNNPQTVGSPIHRDRGISNARGGDRDRGISNAPTGNRDRNHLNTKNKIKGGVTQHHNPMLYKDHLGKIIRWYKGRCTFEMRQRKFQDFAWQTRYYDHIIRNEKELDHIREYIVNNPLKWQFDNENPDQIHETEIKYMVNQ